VPGSGLVSEGASANGNPANQRQERNEVTAVALLKPLVNLSTL